MRVDPLKFLTPLIIFFVTNAVQADSLTPPHEPKDNNFYVCYESCSTHPAVRAPLVTYRKYHYLGCMVSRKPCQTIVVKRAHCQPARLKGFGWFNNYPQTLNAFYRCAYS